MDATPGPTTSLTWANVGLGLGFIFFNVFISIALRLGVGGSLLAAACRYTMELSNVGVMIQHVSDANNPWFVGGIAFGLNLLGTFEAVASKSKKRYDNMFLSVLISMLCSTVPVSIIGARYAMAVSPFWTPAKYIPILGMLCGNVISGIVVAIAYVLEEIHDNRDRVETYLAFGASRFEACLPIAREALRLALAPAISQMSVIGIIYVPGMMTGAVLVGSSVEQATKLQMISMFMISASTALSAIIAIVMALSVVVDSEHRVRPDRINVEEHVIIRTGKCMAAQIGRRFKRLTGCCWRRKKEYDADD